MAEAIQITAAMAKLQRLLIRLRLNGFIMATYLKH